MRRRKHKNLYRRMLERELTGKLFVQCVSNSSTNQYQVSAYRNDAIFKLQLFGPGILPSRYIMRLSEESQRQISRNTIILGYTNDLALWTYSFVDKEIPIEVAYDQNGQSDRGREHTSCCISSQFWRVIECGNNRVSLKLLLDTPIFTKPKTSFLSFLADHDKIFNKLTFFETNVMWNPSKLESLFIYTSIPPNERHNSYCLDITFIYVSHERIFSGYEYGKVQFQCNCSTTAQPFIPSRNWNDMNQCLIVSTGSIIYTLFVRNSETGNIMAQGVWCTSINTSKMEIGDPDCTIEISTYTIVGNRRLITMHFVVNKFDIEQYLPTLLKEVDPKGYISLSDYDFYILKTWNNLIILYLTIIGTSISLPSKGLMKWYHILSVTIDTGIVSVLKSTTSPVETNITEQNPTKDLERIRHYLRKTDLSYEPQYKFYSNTNILRGISLSVVIHPIYPFGICK